MEDQDGECTFFLTLCSFDYKDEKDVIEYVTVRFMVANEHFHTDSLNMAVKTFKSRSSSGRSLPHGNLYKPTSVIVNGKTYDKYVFNIGIKLLEWKKVIPTTTPIF